MLQAILYFLCCSSSKIIEDYLSVLDVSQGQDSQTQWKLKTQAKLSRGHTFKQRSLVNHRNAVSFAFRIVTTEHEVVHMKRVDGTQVQFVKPDCIKQVLVL